MDGSDVVKIEIEHLAGEVFLEIKLEVRASDIVGDVYGSKMTLSADGVRVTIPASFLDTHRELVARVIEKGGAVPSHSRREDHLGR